MMQRHQELTCGSQQGTPARELHLPSCPSISNHRSVSMGPYGVMVMPWGRSYVLKFRVVSEDGVDLHQLTVSLVISGFVHTGWISTLYLKEIVDLPYVSGSIFLISEKITLLVTVSSKLYSLYPDVTHWEICKEIRDFSNWEFFCTRKHQATFDFPVFISSAPD